MIVLALMFAVLVGGVTGLLGSWAGASGTSKSWRRVGIPVLLLLTFGILQVITVGIVSWMTILLMNLAWVYSIGYGIPSHDDAGSTLGRFFFRISGGSVDSNGYAVGQESEKKRANIFTRLSIGLLKIVGLIWIPIINGNWAVAVPALIMVALNTVIWGALVEDEGMFNFLHKDLLFEEFFRYYGDGCLAVIMMIV